MSTSSTYEICVLDRMYERRRYIQLLTILFPHVAIASKNIHDIANRIASQFFGFAVPFVLFIYFSTSKICFAEDTAHINSSIGAKCYSIAWIRFDIHFCGTLFHHLVSHSVSFFCSIEFLLSDLKILFNDLCASRIPHFLRPNILLWISAEIYLLSKYFNC